MQPPDGALWTEIASAILSLVPANERKNFHAYLLDMHSREYAMTADHVWRLIKDFQHSEYTKLPTVVWPEDGSKYLVMDEGL